MQEKFAFLQVTEDKPQGESGDGEELVFNGSKFFNTGGVVSDATILEGVLDGTEDHIFTIVPTKQPGIQFGHDWDNIGM
ncbi:hypothetical protein Z517_09359 [Fonsecaea pedrosoi CBS 271.37]|uniref:Acyl-CoA oxidase/dehydrogenase middle domain-containing protein n=1 Tax=Fonsecaea pedrosoi CBS 271.37 TaxID=1442368 RepID=A0A0D2GE45_9EURO|nr:uncharacterized protein Z517_09359 [Fonsecaea pedrosoi CBS 271.37]KIW76915.1 hypothetical protein Z517_09359 [Fonsecaea pedrosoi CBS 271.37]